LANEKRGTKIHFKPDAEIFEVTHFDFDTPHEEWELAFLTKGEDRFQTSSLESRRFHYEEDRSFVQYLNKNSGLHPDLFSLK
jgi:DNA gyrase subunit B